MLGNYWQQLSRKSLSRRRALSFAGGSAAGAVLLSACGGNNGTGKNETKGVITPAVDTTKQAARSGILKDRTYSDVPTLSVSTGGSSPHNAVGPLVYSSLLQFKPGYLKPS